MTQQDELYVVVILSVQSYQTHNATETAETK